ASGLKSNIWIEASEQIGPDRLDTRHRNDRIARSLWNRLRALRFCSRQLFERRPESRPGSRRNCRRGRGRGDRPSGWNAGRLCLAGRFEDRQIRLVQPYPQPEWRPQDGRAGAKERGRPDQGHADMRLRWAAAAALAATFLAGTSGSAGAANLPPMTPGYRPAL